MNILYMLLNLLVFSGLNVEGGSMSQVRDIQEVVRQ
jgi:hypothetical protein